jgi:multidrug efflux system membrane fusion protein
MRTLNAKMLPMRFLYPLVLTVGLLSLILVGSIFFAIWQTSRQALVMPTQDVAEAPVKTAIVTLQRQPLQITAVGTAEAYSSASVKSDVDGQLKELRFTEGQFVKKGNALFEIDSLVSGADLKQSSEDQSEALARQQLAETALIKDRAQAMAAEVEAERFDGLFKDGVVSKEEDDRMRTIADKLEAVVRVDQDAITSEQESIGAMEPGIPSSKPHTVFHSIRSPIDGVTGNLVVNRGDAVIAATPLVTIEQINPIYVSFGVPESQLAYIKSCMARGELQVAATVANNTLHPEQGTLRLTDAAQSGGSGTALLKATFENKDQRLLPGQLVDVVLTLTLPPDAVAISSSALQTEDSGQYVFVVKSDQTVESRSVVVAVSVGDKSIVASGLGPGEIVVTESELPLRSGIKVNAPSNAD